MSLTNQEKLLNPGTDIVNRFHINSLIWNDPNNIFLLRHFLSSSEAEQAMVEAVVSTVDHSDICGSSRAERRHGHDLD